MRAWLSKLLRPMAVPREARAESRGRAMANSEPKTNSSTTAARTTAAVALSP